jgi:hypothetical protein
MAFSCCHPGPESELIAQSYRWLRNKWRCARHLRAPIPACPQRVKEPYQNSGTPAAQLRKDLVAGQLQPPTSPLRELFNILQGIQIGDEPAVGAFMHMHQLGLAFDQVAAAQIGVAGQDLRAGCVVQHDGFTARAADHWHHNISPGSLLEGGDQLGDTDGTV